MTVETPDVENDSESQPGEPIDPNPSLVESRERYRTERDAAREELATVTARVERMQRAEVERLASEHLSVGADLFINDNTVADYLTEDGDVDADKVAADVAVILAERPGLRGRAPHYDPSHGLGGNGPHPKREPTMADLFKPAPGNNGPQILHYS